RSLAIKTRGIATRCKWSASLPVMPVNRLNDLLAGRPDWAQVLVQNELQLLHLVKVGRIGRDELDRAVLIGQRQDSVCAGNACGYEIDDRWRDGQASRVDVGDSLPQVHNNPQPSTPSDGASTRASGPNSWRKKCFTRARGSLMRRRPFRGPERASRPA